jgi:hypothetical protein
VGKAACADDVQQPTTLSGRLFLVSTLVCCLAHRVDSFLGLSEKHELCVPKTLEVHQPKTLEVLHQQILVTACVGDLKAGVLDIGP